MGRDPVEEEGGLNLYGFCRKNAINAWDYLGNYAIYARDGNNITITVPLYFAPGTDQKIIDNAKNGITNMWKGQFGDVTVTTVVEIMKEAPSAKNMGNTVNIVAPVGVTSISNFGTDPRTGNGLFTMYEGRTTESTFAHETGHAIGLKDQYERAWANLDTGEDEWYPAGVVPEGRYDKRPITRVVDGWQNTLMGDRGVLTISKKDFDLLMDGMSKNNVLWVRGPDGTLRKATDTSGNGKGEAPTSAFLAELLMKAKSGFPFTDIEPPDDQDGLE